jgi:hypothetical protein
MPQGIVPQISGQGLELTGESWADFIQTPLMAMSVIMSLPGVNIHASSEPFHIPILGEAVVSRTVGDGVLNSTSTVTSATAAFVAGDVNSYVTGPGIPAGTRIVSVTNATTVVLSAAATTTGSGVALAIGDSVFAAPGDTVWEGEGVTSQLTLMSRSLKAAKILIKISAESLRSSDALGASQIMLLNQLRKILDRALLMGDANAGIVGLMNAAGVTATKHSRTVADGVLNSSTTVTSATAAFTSADVGSGIIGVGIPSGATIASVTNATTVVISAAATATGSGVTLTIAVAESILGQMVDALTAAQDAYANPRYWLVSAPTIGVLRKLTDTLGRPLLQPDLTQQGMEMLLGRSVIPCPGGSLPHGVAILIDPAVVHVVADITGTIKLALEAFIQQDMVGLLVSSRWDIGVTIPAGVQVITGLGPN